MSETKEMEFKWEFTSSNKYYNKHFTLNILYIFTQILYAKYNTKVFICKIIIRLPMFIEFYIFMNEMKEMESK